MTRQTRNVIGRAWAIRASAAVVVLLAMPARASAQATLSGCYVPNSGTVYRIKGDGLPDACRSKQHVEFTWSLQGPVGPAGPQGPTGAQGVAGPAGGLTKAGVETVLAELPTIPAGGTAFLQVSCPTGKAATGGGFEILTAQLRVTSSRPVNASTWSVSFANEAATAGGANAFAVCVPAQ